MILQDQSYLIQKEINQRRQTRVQQARQRANEVARVIRQRTEREKIRLVRVCGSFILYVCLLVKTTRTVSILILQRTLLLFISLNRSVEWSLKNIGNRSQLSLLRWKQSIKMLYVILDSAMKVLPKRYVPVHDKDNYVRILSRLFPDSQTVLQIDIHSFKNSFERHSIFFNW